MHAPSAISHQLAGISPRTTDHSPSFPVLGSSVCRLQATARPLLITSPPRCAVKAPALRSAPLSALLSTLPPPATSIHSNTRTLEHSPLFGRETRGSSVSPTPYTRPPIHSRSPLATRNIFLSSIFLSASSLRGAPVHPCPRAPRPCDCRLSTLSTLPPCPSKNFPTLESCTLALFPAQNRTSTVSQAFRRYTWQIFAARVRVTEYRDDSPRAPVLPRSRSHRPHRSLNIPARSAPPVACKTLAPWRSCPSRSYRETRASFRTVAK